MVCGYNEWTYKPLRLETLLFRGALVCLCGSVIGESCLSGPAPSMAGMPWALPVADSSIGVMDLCAITSTSASTARVAAMMWDCFLRTSW